jgi:hypothetical protein
VVVSRFREVPALTAAQVFGTPVTNPARKVQPSYALAGKSLPPGFPTTQATSINADLLDFLNPGPETPDGETCAQGGEGDDKKPGDAGDAGRNRPARHGVMRLRRG